MSGAYLPGFGQKRPDLLKANIMDISGGLRRLRHRQLMPLQR